MVITLLCVCYCENVTFCYIYKSDVQLMARESFIGYGQILKMRGPSHRWENNIRVYLNEICWEGVDWIHMTQGMTSGGHL
jgi:hypothetical protein